MKKRERKKIKFICSGCGVEFDLSYTHFKVKSAWGRKKFYHSNYCANTYNAKILQNKKL